MMTSIKAPRINPNDDEVGVVGWHVDDGGYIEVGDELVDLETSKATITVEAEIAGYVRRLAKIGDIVRVGEPIAHVADSLEAVDSIAHIGSAQAVDSTHIVRSGNDRTPFTSSPSGSEALERAASGLGRMSSAAQPRYSSMRLSNAAQELSREMHLRSEQFANAGLVTARDVRAWHVAQTLEPVEMITSLPNRQDEPWPLSARAERLSLSKRAEIQSLIIGASGAINSTLSVYFDSAGIRARLDRDALFDGSIQPLLLYEISRLLRVWPQFTAHFAADSICFYDRVDLGLAIDLGDGLKVVTIRDADKLTPQQIFEQTLDFGLRYIEKRLRPDELAGSTCTITDLSGLDILHFKPLINGRQSTIIGLGGDRMQPGSPMSVNMTFDHRVATGREVGSFLNELRTRMLTYSVDAAPVQRGSSSVISNPPIPHATGSPPCCDRCGIDFTAYSKEFGTQAHMLAHFRPDGSLGGVCHRCFDGWA